MYREYKPIIELPAEVFNIGPHAVTDYQCGGKFEQLWSLSTEPEVQGIHLIFDSEATRLQIDDTATPTRFILAVTGVYTF